MMRVFKLHRISSILGGGTFKRKWLKTHHQTLISYHSLTFFFLLRPKSQSYLKVSYRTACLLPRPEPLPRLASCRSLYPTISIACNPACSFWASRSQTLTPRLHPRKLPGKWKRKTNHLKMYLLSKMMNFDCHSNFRAGKSFLNIT